MRRIILAFVIAALTPAMGHAWGTKGHKVVAALSLEYLSDSARAGVQSLLGPDDSNYINAAVWADQIRNDRPQTKPWHFVDIPNNAPGYDPARDCKNQNCAVARIDLFAKQLADRKAAKAKRVEALKFVIHFVGDIHQPLHGAEDDNDQGGNLVFVTVDGITDKLHSVWDTQLVNKLGSTPGGNRREPREPHLRGRREEVQPGNAEGLGRGVAQDRARLHLRAEQGQGARRGQSGRAAERLPRQGTADRALAALARCGPPRDGAQQGVREAEGKAKGKGRSSNIFAHILPWNFFSAVSTKRLSNVSSTLMLAAFTSGRNAASTSCTICAPSRVISPSGECASRILRYELR